jgi:hypothetical protein
MKNILSIFVSFLMAGISMHSNAEVFWTVKTENGVLTSSSGTVAINIGNNTPTSPNPSGTNWNPCNNNWIFLNKTADGSTINSKYIDRMLAVALVAYKTDTAIRVKIERDASNNCYSSQIFG